MRKRRVIIFEEEPSVQHLLEVIFSRRGYEVVSFREPVICPVYENNQDGNCIKEYPCADVIITDQEMRFMSGIELLRKQTTRGCKLTTMNKAVMSSSLTESEQKDLQELGGFFLVKPFHLDQISRWVDACEQRLDINTPVIIRRREKRTPVRVPVTYCTEAMDKIMAGTVTDLSRSGFCLTSNRNFDPAETVKLVSDLPYTCSVASARWSKKTENGVFITGFSCD